LDDLTHKLAQKQAQLAALREIGRALSSAWALEPTLDLISRKTTQVRGVDSCSIYLLQSDDERLLLQATTGLDPQAIGRAQLRMGQGLTGWAARHETPVAVRDAAADPRFKLLPETHEKGLRSLAAVPLTSQGRVIGAMNVQTAGPHDFEAEALELLSLIGDLAAGALEKAALYDSMRRQIQELSTLAEVSQAVTSPLYLDEMLGVVVDMATQVMHAKLCALMLIDESGQRLLPIATPSQSAGYANRPVLRVGQGITGQVAASGQPATVADVRTEPRYALHDLATQEGLVALLSAPLSVRERVIGVFNCYMGQPHTFSAPEIALFQTLANQTALAIENARLVAGAAIVREMHHRVKNNLQTIAMLLRLQMSDGPERPAAEVLPEAINRILAIAAVHETLSEGDLRQVDVKAVLTQIADSVVQNLSHPHKTLQVTVEGDETTLPSKAATALALAVNELLQNALEHAFVGRDRGDIQVQLCKEEKLTITLTDDGVGLAAGAEGESKEASLGLEIVRTLVTEDLNGSFTLTPGPTGTRAVIQLPRPR